MASPPFSILFILLLLLLLMLSATTKSSSPQAADDEAKLKPIAAAEPAGGHDNKFLQSKFWGGSSHRLGVCTLCICCGGPRGLCFATPCCYSINCNIPNRPFGFCSFTPRACNCFGCHL